MHSLAAALIQLQKKGGDRASLGGILFSAATRDIFVFAAACGADSVTEIRRLSIIAVFRSRLRPQLDLF